MVGLGVSEGIALGRACWLRKKTVLTTDDPSIKVSDIPAEVAKFREALKLSWEHELVNNK